MTTTDTDLPAGTATPVPTAPAEDVEAFRDRLVAFLTAHSPGKAPKGSTERLAWQRAWCATMVDHGFAGPGWPRAYGGMDLPFSHQLVYAEEIARARAPSQPGTGVGIAGPTIVRYGTPEQRERWLRPMLRADVIWAQGFSEPDAGSDLPSLRTRAVPDGDGYRVTGQKVWSTHAHDADLLYALVRTGPPDSRQHGISYVVIDAHQPGVTVRRLKELTGDEGFCEIFFDGAWVAARDRIGEENAGWGLARASLGHERAASALIQAGFYRRIVDELLALARQRGVTGSQSWRRRLADVETSVRLMTLNALRVVDTILRTGDPGPAASVSRLYNSTFEQRLHETAVDLLGSFGLLDRGDPYAVQRGRWVWGMLRTRASTIGAGTAEIQRNTIAERVLGLPRDPAMPAA
jgi:alkylation response protein AidB-like acyl-CoA dehydrogenase